MTFRKSDRLPSIQKNLMNEFETGLQNYYTNKLTHRGDLIYLGKQVSSSPPRFNRYKNPIPVLVTSDGRNLFSLSPDEVSQMNDIFEFCIEEVADFEFLLLQKVVSLAKLTCRFSYVSLKDPYPTSTDYFFPNLEYLDLSFNGLLNEVLIYISEISSLKELNLSGNKLDNVWPSLSSLVNLEKLVLAYNNISSKFVDEKRIMDLNEEEDTSEVRHSKLTDKMLSVIVTDVQDMFMKLSELPKLRYLDISNNKLQFFDIKTEEKFTGFNSLEVMNLSNNLVSEEVSMLLFVNCPALKELHLYDNPICKLKGELESLELELFTKVGARVLTKRSKDKEDLVIRKDNLKSYNKLFSNWRRELSDCYKES